MSITPEQRAAFEAIAEAVHESMGSQWHYCNYGDYKTYAELPDSLKEMLHGAVMTVLHRSAALNVNPPGFILVREETARSFLTYHPYGNYAPSSLNHLNVFEWMRKQGESSDALAKELHAHLFRQDLNDARKEADPK